MSAVLEDVGLEATDFGTIDRQLVKEALNVAERHEKWLMHKETVAPIVNALRKLGADVKLSIDLDVRLIGDARTLAGAVRVLRTAGYSFTSRRPAKGDTGWHSFFHRQGSLSIWLNFSSSVCRRVQTGTSMVETPVYETVCDSIELPTLTEEDRELIERQDVEEPRDDSQVAF